MNNVYLLHFKNGNKTFTKDEIIKNAKDQERNGAKPCYRHFAMKEKGWLVWSTFEDGAGVVVKYENGNYNIVTGWQGDFIFG